MLLQLLLLCLALVHSIAGQKHHCRDSADCPLYPLDSCFATDAGMICQNPNANDGFITSLYDAETFIYHPAVLHNDTGEPCHTIPRSKDLEKYVSIRGPEVMDMNDLDLIGNCSRISYCDKTTHTCQPKRPVGSHCDYNMQCWYSMSVLPGLCRNSSCTARDTLYLGPGLEMTVGEHWKEALVAVLITGTLAICVLVGRYQAGKLVSGVSGLIEKWQNRDTLPSSSVNANAAQTVHNDDQSTSFLIPNNEEFWQQQHARSTWLFALPGGQRLARLFNLKRRDDGTYVPLDARPIDPPAYRDD